VSQDLPIDTKNPYTLPPMIVTCFVESDPGSGIGTEGKVRGRKEEGGRRKEEGRRRKKDEGVEDIEALVGPYGYVGVEFRHRLLRIIAPHCSFEIFEFSSFRSPQWP
jgi:hypothetical protein